MGKKLPYIFLLWLLLLSCNASNYSSRFQYSILGKWTGEFVEQNWSGNPITVQYNLVFLPFNILLIQRSTDKRISNGMYRYYFTEENRIVVTGRLYNELNISINADRLFIQSTYETQPNGEFTRVSSFWEWLFVILIFIIFIPIGFRKLMDGILSKRREKLT